MVMVTVQNNDPPLVCDIEPARLGHMWEVVSILQEYFPVLLLRPGLRLAVGLDCQFVPSQKEPVCEKAMQMGCENLK